MATKQTSMHTFSGQLGSTVGYAKYGENYERMLGGSKNPRNPRTTKQLAVRSKFSLLTAFANKLTGFINVTFKSSVMPATSAFFKKNYSVVFTGTYPEFEINFDKVIVSTGSLLLPESPDADVDGSILSVSWTDNTGQGNAKANDEAMLLAYNSVKGAAVQNLDAGKRSERVGTLNLPSSWSGDSVDCWFAMRDPETGRLAESIYLGNFNI